MWKTKILSLLCLLIFIPSNSIAQDILKEGEFLLKEGQYLKARDFFKKYIEVQNVADQALLGIGKSEYFLENYPEAILYLRRLLRDFKDSPHVNEANLFLGMSYLKQGKVKDAEFYLKKVSPPLEQKARIGLGWIHLQKGDLKVVESIVNQIDNKELKMNPDAALLRVKYLAQTGKPEQALKEFEKNPKLRRFEIERAEILYRANKLNEAERLLRKIVLESKKLMDTIQAKNLLFEVYLSQGKTDEAMKVAKDILLYMPNDNFKTKVYSIYNSQQNYDEAFKILLTLRDRKVKLKKMEEFVNDLIKNKPDRASEFIIKTYPFLSNDSIYLIEWSNFLIKEGKLAEAKNLLRKAQSGPRKSETTLPFAQILVKEGKINEAKKLLESLKDKNSLAVSLYGQILLKEGDRVGALNHFRKVAEKITEPDLLESIGDLEYSIGDRKRAIKYWIDAASRGRASSALKAADYFYLNNNLQISSEYYKKAIELNLQDNESLMWAYYQYGKITKNKSYLEKVANSEGKLSQAAKELLERL